SSTVATCDEDGDALGCKRAEALVDGSQFAGAKRIFIGAITDAEHLHFVVNGDAVEHIDQFLSKWSSLTIGLIVKDLGLGSETRNQFEIQSSFALTSTGGKVSINVNILNMRRGDTDA